METPALGGNTNPGKKLVHFDYPKLFFWKAITFQLIIKDQYYHIGTDGSPMALPSFVNVPKNRLSLAYKIKLNRQIKAESEKAAAINFLWIRQNNLKGSQNFDFFA